MFGEFFLSFKYHDYISIDTMGNFLMQEYFQLTRGVFFYHRLGVFFFCLTSCVVSVEYICIFQTTSVLQLTKVFRPTQLSGVIFNWQGKYFSIEWYFDLTTRIFLLHDYFPTDKVAHFQNTRSFFYDVREINSNSSVTIYRGWELDWCIWLSPLYFDFWLFQIILIQK